MRRALTSLILCGVAIGGAACDEPCAAGEEWCDGDRIMICIDGDAEGEDWDDDGQEDDGLWELIDLAVPDNYAAVKRDCAEVDKTCTMRTDAHGREYGYCWYRQTL